MGESGVWVNRGGAGVLLNRGGLRGAALTAVGGGFCAASREASEPTPKRLRRRATELSLGTRIARFVALQGGKLGCVFWGVGPTLASSGANGAGAVGRYPIRHQLSVNCCALSSKSTLKATMPSIPVKCTHR